MAAKHVTHWIGGKPWAGTPQRQGDIYDPATGQVTPREVNVGINNNIYAEITDGLSEGDHVLATGSGLNRPTNIVGPGGGGGGGARFRGAGGAFGL